MFTETKKQGRKEDRDRKSKGERGKEGKGGEGRGKGRVREGREGREEGRLLGRANRPERAGPFACRLGWAFPGPSPQYFSHGISGTPLPGDQASPHPHQDVAGLGRH